MNERYTRLRAAVDAAVKRGDVGGDYRTYDVGSLLCDYDALAARLAAVEKYIIVLARLRRWLKEGAVLRATDPSKPVLEDVDGYFHGGITVSYESEAEKARLAEALASEERTQRLWDEAEARLAEATDLIDEAYNHGDTESWGERAAKFLRAASSADAAREER